MEIKVDEKSLKSLTDKLNNIASNIEKNTADSIISLLTQAQQVALQNYRVSKDKNKIPYEVETNNSTIKGKLKTNMPINNSGIYKSSAPMREYGTGKLGELEKIGKTSTFIESGYEYWLLPVDKAPRTFSNEIVTNKAGVQFYVMYSQPPRPFMRPTAFWLKSNTKKVLPKELKEKIRSDIK